METLRLHGLSPTVPSPGRRCRTVRGLEPCGSAARELTTAAVGWDGPVLVGTGNRELGFHMSQASKEPLTSLGVT